MDNSKPMRWLSWLKHLLVHALVIGGMAVPARSQDEQGQSRKQIVILHTHRPMAPICLDWDRGIRNSVLAGTTEPIDIEIEYLNLSRFNSPDYLRSWIELLKAKYANNPPDLIIPVFVPALQFTLEHRESIFPDVPIVFCSAPLPLAERAHAEPNVFGVAFRLDLQGTLAAMKRLHPANRRLMVLSGSSAQEQALKSAAQQEILRLKQDLKVEFVDGLPLAQLLEKLRTVEEATSILMLSYDEDMAGNHYMTTEITKRLAAECPLPVYGLYDTLLGHGIVGGSLVSAESQGKLAGDLAVRVLNGERPENVDTIGLGGEQMKFDSRQLRRWNISEAALPPSSLVMYREPTFWEEFGHLLLLGIAAFMVQSLIIAALLLNRSRRLRAESDAQQLAGQILTAQEDERRYIAREMHDDLSQRLAASAIVAGNLEQELHTSAESRDALGTLKGSLIAICDDMHRLSRKLHPAILDDFGLADALRAECDRVGDRDGVEVEFRCGQGLVSLPKRTALCLYRIAQEALWNSSKYAQSDRVILELNSDSESVYLEVQDFGVGFDLDDVSARQSLGLASMRERTRLVRGTISIDSARGEGAKVSVRVPLPENEA